MSSWVCSYVTRNVVTADHPHPFSSSQQFGSPPRRASIRLPLTSMPKFQLLKLQKFQSLSSTREGEQDSESVVQTLKIPDEWLLPSKAIEASHVSTYTRCTTNEGSQNSLAELSQAELPVRFSKTVQLEQMLSGLFCANVLQSLSFLRESISLRNVLLPFSTDLRGYKAFTVHCKEKAYVRFSCNNGDEHGNQSELDRGTWQISSLKGSYQRRDREQSVNK
ncbi:uncharacterized protein LOC108838862 isoform X2 [Raphanus sativus]|uniref:Uncharacterized protein LOC108838862 isoform X2 n=1 Tax=Raphanus sativus TaxID=3726 RepID=A0A9W3D2A6_RAPSA|nr:uncharacterized protein LOC108838862 isoform X2 [Raphanus sativus]